MRSRPGPGAARGPIRWLVDAIVVTAAFGGGVLFVTRALPPHAGGVGAALASGSEVRIVCEGRLVQGGGAVCRTHPKSRARIGTAQTRSDEKGLFVVGFDRDAPRREIVRVWLPEGGVLEEPLEIEARTWTVSRIDGLPDSQVDRFTEEQLVRIEASTERKRRGDDSRARLDAFREGFSWPLAGRRTSPFGAQRILNGVRKRPHYGVDLAAPEGTTVRAPADALVALADDDLYFEGAMVVLDHGQGLLSKYLHLSRIDVRVGDRVRRGQRIGAVGSRGRATGPHLCWRLQWRDRHLDPELWIASSGIEVGAPPP